MGRQLVDRGAGPALAQHAGLQARQFGGLDAPDETIASGTGEFLLDVPRGGIDPHAVEIHLPLSRGEHGAPHAPQAVFVAADALGEEGGEPR